MAKRIFDVIAALLGLLLLAPVFALIAVWIKLDSTGPVYFKQARVGRFGKPFLIHKFRTMHVNSEESGRLTVGVDPRITRPGHFLRKIKADELPQLLDVLLGRMSLVGPRPEVQEFINYYPKKLREKILSVRPGITDKASIEMVDENLILAKYDNARKAYIDIILPIKQAYYVEYVDTQNFFLDLKLIALTIKKIFIRAPRD